MGVSSTTNRVVLDGDGSSVSFSFPYYFFSQSDLIVLIFDTLLGGFTQQVLNSDYTISGTPNFSGLYPSGASVVFNAAPLSTDAVIIIRNGAQVQNYALLQGGTISSSAIVQQLDYLTLLIQRLQDQATRSIHRKDGDGASMDMGLPSNLSLLPLGYVQVNSDGTGLQVTDNPSSWQSVTKTYSDLQIGSTTKHAALFTLPAGNMLTGLVIKHSEAFAGTSITDVMAQIGLSGSYGQFIGSFDIFDTVSDTDFDNLSLNFIASWASDTTIYLTALSTGANLSALSQGSVTVYYKYDKVA